MKALKSSEGKFGIEGSPRGDNLFIWVSVSCGPTNVSVLDRSWLCDGNGIRLQLSRLGGGPSSC